MRFSTLQQPNARQFCRRLVARNLQVSVRWSDGIDKGFKTKLMLHVHHGVARRQFFCFQFLLWYHQALGEGSINLASLISHGEVMGAAEHLYASPSRIVVYPGRWESDFASSSVVVATRQPYVGTSRWSESAISDTHVTIVSARRQDFDYH
ncbi:uncharacterized protein ARMOST_18926 [Armillaria ostoyae]|uniref:Uncharacterized protein n=1 Tax=Armillaria ostoyae TaxID=47428 RepID=A0A284S363_ARMOS|nr:uncharacterized protein ARMOST_18926 [Armillaria ostoyae]